MQAHPMATVAIKSCRPAGTVNMIRRRATGKH